MAQPTQNHLLKVLIGKDIARSITAGTVVTNANLADGEVVVTDVSNAVLNTTTVLGLDKVKIVQGRGSSNPLREEILHLNDITSYKANAYSPRVNQVSYIGYNGTSGAIDVINDNLYQYVFRDLTDELMRGFQGFEVMPYYRSDSSATQEEIAIGLEKSTIAAFSKIYGVERYVKIELVNAHAGAAITGTVANFGVTLGSKTVTLDGTVTNVAVGDYLRLGGTGTTAPVYKVDAVTSPTSITLDWSYQGTTATIAVANVEVITEAQAQANNFGMKFTGLDRYFDKLRWQYAVERFKIGLGAGDGFGSTTVTYTTDPFEGTGVWEKVTEMEFASWGNEGQAIIMQQPPILREKDTVDGEPYSLVGISFKNVVPSDFGDSGIHKGQVILACAANSTAPNTFLTNFTGAATSVVDVLDAFVTQNGNFSAQAGNL